MCDALVNRARKVNYVLCSTLKALASNKPVKSSVYKSSKEGHENARKNVRKKEDSKKAIREKNERLIVSVVQVASLIMSRGLWTNIWASSTLFRGSSDQITFRGVCNFVHPI